MRTKCDACRTKLLVEPIGPLNSDILLVGDYPGYEEIKAGSPFVGKTGDVLKAELGRVGIQYTKCRMTNLWLHEKDSCDVNYHIKMLVAEMYQKRYILLMGSEVCSTLLGKGVMDVAGLIVTSPYIPKDATAIACPNPAYIVRGGRIGEVRMAIEKFARIVRGG